MYEKKLTDLISGHFWKYKIWPIFCISV